MHIAPLTIRRRLSDLENQEYKMLDLLPNKDQIKIDPPTRGKDKKPRVSGQEHKNWIHGKGKTRDYDPQAYAIWKECVLRKYNFKCMITNAVTNLACHHLNSWDWDKEGRYDPENGVIITKEMHTQFHAKYGYGNNTRQQFERFLLENFNISKFPWQQGNHEPSLTKREMTEVINQRSQDKNRELIELISSRNHILIAGGYENRNSKLCIKCLIHNTIYQTTATNYKKSKTGMPCCAKEIQSKVTSYHNTLRSKRADN